MADDKSKQLNETLSQIEKQFGKGTVMRMGDREVVDIPAISTGSIGLDIALGISIILSSLFMYLVFNLLNSSNLLPVNIIIINISAWNG